MSIIDQFDKIMADAGDGGIKQEKYIKQLRLDPNFQQYVIEPIKSQLKQIESVGSIDTNQEAQQVLVQLEAQRQSVEYLRSLLSFLAGDDIN